MSKKYTPIKDPHRYKTYPCYNFTTFGKCPYGKKCQYAHGINDLRPIFGYNILDNKLNNFNIQNYPFLIHIKYNYHLKYIAIKCAEYVLQ